MPRKSEYRILKETESKKKPKLTRLVFTKGAGSWPWGNRSVLMTTMYNPLQYAITSSFSRQRRQPMILDLNKSWSPLFNNISMRAHAYFFLRARTVLFKYVSAGLIGTSFRLFPHVNAWRSRISGTTTNLLSLLIASNSLNAFCFLICLSSSQSFTFFHMNHLLVWNIFHNFDADSTSGHAIPDMANAPSFSWFCLVEVWTSTGQAPRAPFQTSKATRTRLWPKIVPSLGYSIYLTFWFPVSPFFISLILSKRSTRQNLLYIRKSQPCPASPSLMAIPSVIGALSPPLLQHP
jgi:hypothetical protein